MGCPSMHVLYAAVRDKSTAMSILSQFVYVRTYVPLEQLTDPKTYTPQSLSLLLRNGNLLVIAVI